MAEEIQDSGILSKVFIFIASLLLICALVYWALTFYFGIRVDPIAFFEQQAPEIYLVDDQDKVRRILLGVEPTKLSFVVKDNGAGLDEVLVTVEQWNVTRDIYKRALHGEKISEISFQVDGRRLGIEEGQFKIYLKAFDRSFWSNKRMLVLDGLADYIKPKLSLLSAQHNMSEGGSQLVIYRAEDKNLHRDGVIVNGRFFKGAPLSFIDPKFENDSIRFVIYPFNQASSPSVYDVKIFAEDKVGNKTEGSVPHRIRRVRYRETEINVTNTYVEKVRNLSGFDSAQMLDVDRGLLGDAGSIIGKAIESLKEKDETKIEEFLSNREISQRQWDTAFDVPTADPVVRFGERVTYIWSGEPVFGEISKGYVFRDLEGSQVSATARGRVIYVGRMEAYGNTVMIDHGLGIVSLYGWLDNVYVSVGDLVEGDQPIGTVGMTGLAFAPGFYFELRVQGVQVNPLEWWDRKWVDSHIFSKVKRVKEILGIEDIRSQSLL